jgi:hypothetical protein
MIDGVSNWFEIRIDYTTILLIWNEIKFDDLWGVDTLSKKYEFR